jgi:hypothetical protein
MQRLPASLAAGSAIVVLEIDFQVPFISIE